jgi:hypothetical protein
MSQNQMDNLPGELCICVEAVRRFPSMLRQSVDAQANEPVHRCQDSSGFDLFS